MSTKLRLKETPEERERRKAKEERRAARKKQKSGPDLHFDYANEVEDRQWKLSEPIIYRTPNDAGASYNLETEPSSSSRRSGKRGDPKPVNYEQIQKELEEANFRAKLFDAMDDDERLDSIQARFNAYHVPERWQDAGPSSDTNNPNVMDEDEYAEWVRRGMWERRHQAEIEEQKRQEKEREERKARVKNAEKERRRMENDARQRHREHEKDISKRAYDAYLSAWSLLAARGLANSTLRLTDIPWPVHSSPAVITTITPQAVSAFLFSDLSETDKPRKQRIREALLIYHPDRFEKWAAMIMDEGERQRAREVAGTVSRVLNSLAEQ
ncbi:hypothetical protein M408DRAFT_7106 [Serendipita vermifera MAFF 305830]|uniref:Uncharacterized protein n=1 Tax=Serendipita vermifera MAFF 305830 TaxID=933852 RepID=A0A0C2WYY4_SERVB|nr:hypothetical protein M408DRAFT_7106 [Serendipita vermifera MAFF 305830]